MSAHESETNAAPAPTISRVDGLLQVATSFLESNAGMARSDRFHIMLHLDADKLSQTEADADMSETELAFMATLDDGSRVSAATLRRVLCDCPSSATLENSDGNPLYLGRKTRAVSPALFRALLRRAAGCRFPSCAHRRHLHAHHARHWVDGGETSIDTLFCCVVRIIVLCMNVISR